MEKTYSVVVTLLITLVLGLSLGDFAQAQSNRKLPHWPILEARANARRHGDTVPELPPCCEVQKTVELTALLKEAPSARGTRRAYKIICSPEVHPQESIMYIAGDKSSCAFGDKDSQMGNCAESCVKQHPGY